MASNVNDAIPTDTTAMAATPIRTNFVTIKAELTALMEPAQIAVALVNAGTPYPGTNGVLNPAFPPGSLLIDSNTDQLRFRTTGNTWANAIW